ncbi:MAG: filamentous hemagglutinin N-terminal domain-containing protein, partial [Cyanobacteria bacterium]|nr:filamentous hemagglutinin N-terminal domain-containing protein [Cyanobacteriota bacterium]
MNSIIFRSKKNAHRLFYFLNGKLKSFLTHEKDVLANVAEMFGALNPLSATKTATTAAFAVIATLSLLSQAPSFALPQGGQSVSGDVTFNQNGNTLDVNTSANRSIANYNSFNVANGETVNFNLPGASSAILNRVIGGNPSQIFGAINSNGQVFLINPSGVLFGSTAQVNVGSLFASTLNISDQNFLNGNLVFNRDPNSNASVVNQGLINITKGGFAVLTGSAVSNSGSINAPNGQVFLAVGDQVTLNLGNGISADVTVDKALQSKVSGVQNAINNSGLIKADGGLIKLQADLQNNFYNRLVNNTGTVEALSVKESNGVISFVGNAPNGTGTVTNAGIVNASGTAENANAGSVSIQGGTVQQNGTILAEGTDGGNGGKVALTSALDTTLGNGSYISVAGNDNASAGTVAVKAGRNAFFNDGATINAQGGNLSGNAGFVEISGQNRVQYRGLTQLGAASGAVGTLLIDPTNFIFSTDASPALLNTAGNVNIWATRDILVDSVANFGNIASGSLLSLNAGRNLTVSKNLSTGGGNMSLNANADTTAFGGSAPSGLGDFTLQNLTNINTNGGSLALTGRDVNVKGSINAANSITGIASRNVYVTETGSITGANNTDISLSADVANRMYGSINTSDGDVTLTSFANGTGITSGLNVGYLNYTNASITATGASNVFLNGRNISVFGNIQGGDSVVLNSVRSAQIINSSLSVNDGGTVNISAGNNIAVAGSTITANGGGTININADTNNLGTGLFQNSVNSVISAVDGSINISGGRIQQAATLNAGTGSIFLTSNGGNITVLPTSTMTASVFIVNANNGSVVANGNIGSAGTVFTAVQASGSISGTGTIAGTNLSLGASNGSIGTSAVSRLTIKGKNLN